MMMQEPMQEPDDKERIRQNVAKMRSQGASDAEVEHYLTNVEGLKPVGEAAPAPLIPPMTHAQSRGTVVPRSFGGAEEKAGVVHRALDEVPFATKGMAGLDALGSATKTAVAGRSLTDVAEGKPGDFMGTLKAAYNQNYGARKQAIETFKHEHPKQSTVAAGVGILAPILATMGGSAAFEGAAEGAEAIPTLTKLFKGAKLGAKYGVLQGASEAHGSLEDYEKKMLMGGALGAVGGGVVGPVVGKVAGIVAKPTGKAVSAVSGYLAERFPEGRAGQIMGRLSRATGTKGAAAERMGNAAEADQQAGFVPNDVPKGFDAIALDKAGPATEGVAEGIAHRQGPGRAVIHTRLNKREAGMRGTVSKAFDEGTGTSAEEGEALLQRLADEHANLDRVEGITKAVRTEDRASSRAKQAAPNVLGAWRAEMGGSLSNGLATLRNFVKGRSEEASRLFGEARTGTAGQGVDTPTLRELRATPIGKQAFAWAEAQKGNRMSPLPQVTHMEMPEEIRALGVSEANWQKTVEKMREQGITPPSATESVADHETLHFAKQYLSKVARLGIRDGQGGKLATEAQGALNVWGRVREEMHPLFRKADDAYAERSGVIDMLNRGRDVMRTQLNPSGNKALHHSVDAVERELAQASPQEQAAFRIGAQSAITDYLRSAGRSPDALALQLREPTSALSRRIALATGDASTATRLADRLTRPPTLVHTVAPPPPSSGVLAPLSKAAGRGLDVLKHGVSAPGNAPERSLSVLERDVAALSPGEQGSFRSGAAQAVRGEFAGSTAKAPGRVFGTEGSERARQVRQAFPDQEKAKGFQDVVSAYDRAAQQKERVLGNSRTGFRNAMEAKRVDEVTPSAIGEAVRGRPGQALRQIGGASRKAADEAQRQKEDKIIAEWLTSADAQHIPEALRATLLRRLARTETRKGLAKLGGNALAAQRD